MHNYLSIVWGCASLLQAVRGVKACTPVAEWRGERGCLSRSWMCARSRGLQTVALLQVVGFQVFRRQKGECQLRSVSAQYPEGPRGLHMPTHTLLRTRASNEPRMRVRNGTKFMLRQNRAIVYPCVHALNIFTVSFGGPQTVPEYQLLWGCVSPM